MSDDVERTPRASMVAIDHPDREEVRTVPDGTLAPSYPYEVLRRAPGIVEANPYIIRGEE